MGQLVLLEENEQDIVIHSLEKLWSSDNSLTEDEVHTIIHTLNKLYRLQNIPIIHFEEELWTIQNQGRE